MNKAMIEKGREKGIRVQHPPDKLPGASASRDVDWGATGHMNKEGALYERERKREPGIVSVGLGERLPWLPPPHHRVKNPHVPLAFLKVYLINLARHPSPNITSVLENSHSNNLTQCLCRIASTRGADAQLCFLQAKIKW
jgi:hypothetical protein